MSRCLVRQCNWCVDVNIFDVSMTMHKLKVASLSDLSKCCSSRLSFSKLKIPFPTEVPLH